MKNWHATEGWLDPPGVTWIEEEQAWNFVLYSRDAHRVILLFFDQENYSTPSYQFEFDHYRNKSGPVWHCRIAKKLIPDALYYGYQVIGPEEDELHFHRFDPEKILLDPYSKAVFFPPQFDREAAKGKGTNIGKAPLGVIEADGGFDWGNDQFIQHDSDLVIYEMHIRGFTKHPNSDVTAENQGTFQGVIEKIPYLQDLGITAVELMPVFQYDPQEGNYWGYMPMNFFAPHSGYSTHPETCQEHQQFREMVKALHEAGIEVILDVVYNHTCEGDDRGPNYSFRGIANNMYYMQQQEENRYANYSGCGNTLDSNQVAVRKLIVDSLKYWRDEMHVDGFRFDLASIFARKSDGSIASAQEAPIFSQIVTAEDFLNVRLIAEPWDAAGSYQLGRSFPGWLWMQWNGMYRDTIQRFISGQQGLIGDLMTRLYGSADLFPDDRYSSCRPWQSVNYITSHDGSTIYDLVSYEGKYNWANGENNRDGSHEYKWNCGHEGDEFVSDDVMSLRRQQAKNIFALLLLSNGTPMFRMGDEFLQSQHGNNNAYNQDNETSWLNWERLHRHQEVYQFVKRMIAFRKSHPSICRSHFWREDVIWHGPTGPCDLSPQSQTLAFSLSGRSMNDQDLYVMINGSDRILPFQIAATGPNTWKRVIDTSERSPKDILDSGSAEAVRESAYPMQPRSIAVLVRDA